MGRPPFRAILAGVSCLTLASATAAEEPVLARAELPTMPAAGERLEGLVPQEDRGHKGEPKADALEKALREMGVLKDERTTVWVDSHGDMVYVRGTPAEIAALQTLLDQYNGRKQREKIFQVSEREQRALADKNFSGATPKPFGDDALDCWEVFYNLGALPKAGAAAVLFTRKGQLMVRGTDQEIAVVEKVLREEYNWTPKKEPAVTHSEVLHNIANASTVQASMLKTDGGRFLTGASKIFPEEAAKRLIAIMANPATYRDAHYQGRFEPIYELTFFGAFGKMKVQLGGFDQLYAAEINQGGSRTLQSYEPAAAAILKIIRELHLSLMTPGGGFSD